jgi:hypothetical protein
MKLKMMTENVTGCVSLKNDNMAELWHLSRIRGMPTVFCWVNLKERDNLKDLSVDGRIILIAFQE